MDQPSGKTKWYYEIWSVIVLLFFVAGPFGLPLLYKSPKFSCKAKVILTIAVVAQMVYTIILVVQLFKAGARSLDSLMTL